MLRGKKILIGITGSIAAYKSALLIRGLIVSGAEVRVLMTPSARDFISPLTISTLSKNPVYSDFVRNERGEWTNHVELGLWADVMIVAPATANTIAKMSAGICDNLLLASYLSARRSVFIAPAMDLDMYRHPSTIKNLETLKDHGNLIIPPEHGELASGLTGTGRMAEPEAIIKYLSEYFRKTNSGKEKKALVTAGPTYEKIDPVRFIGNYSTGKMGYALANDLLNRGYEVTLITGPTALDRPDVQHIIEVTSAEDMLKACMSVCSEQDLIIMAAAVADYAPVQPKNQKIKKGNDPLTLELKNTVDIARELGKKKSDQQILVGFALETDNEQKNAVNKLNSKNLDMIVLNSLNDEGAGFGHETNKITIFDKNGRIEKFPLLKKSEIASGIVDYIEGLHNV